jgi:hypothetical protein
LRLPALVLPAAALCALFGAAPATGGEVTSERAGILLVSPTDGGGWTDEGDAHGPALVSRDFAGERLGARAVELEPPDGLDRLDRAAQADRLIDFLDELIDGSYGLVSGMSGPFYYGDEGPLAVSREFDAEGRFIREYLIWDSERLLNLTLWCRAELADALGGEMDALLAGFRW